MENLLLPLVGCPIKSNEIHSVEISDALIKFAEIEKTRHLTICGYLYHIYQQMVDEYCDVKIDINEPGKGRSLPEGVSDPGELDIDSEEEDILKVTILGCRENEEKKKLLEKAASMGCEWATLILGMVKFSRFEGKVIYEHRR